MKNETDASSSRTRMLADLRRLDVPAEPLPAVEVRGIEYADAVEQFTQVLASVGGSAERVADATALARAIARSPAYLQSERRGSLLAIPDFPFTPTDSASASTGETPGSTRLEWNVSLNQVEDTHELAALDFALLPGHLGVAENGAVWVSGHSVRHRVVYFIARHLALVVPADRIVHNLHEAYARIAFAASDNAFGCFISGPSKTADIEQSLVIGAAGARALTVYLITDAASCGLTR